MTDDKYRRAFTGFMVSSGSATASSRSLQTTSPEPLPSLAERFSRGLPNLPVAALPTRMHLNEVVELLRTGQLGSTEVPPTQVW